MPFFLAPMITSQHVKLEQKHTPRDLPLYTQHSSCVLPTRKKYSSKRDSHILHMLICSVGDPAHRVLISILPSHHTNRSSLHDAWIRRPAPLRSDPRRTLPNAATLPAPSSLWQSHFVVPPCRWHSHKASHYGLPPLSLSLSLSLKRRAVPIHLG